MPGSTIPNEAQSRQCHRITREILLNVFHKADFITNSETILYRLSGFYPAVVFTHARE